MKNEIHKNNLHLKKQREYFNSIAEKWDSMCFHDAARIREILDISGIKEGDTVLDIGSGTGIMIPYIILGTGPCGSVTCVDISENMVEIAKRKHKYNNVRFITGDALKVNIRENHFDCIMCYSCFPHFNDKQGLINKMKKHLAKGGRLVISHSQSRDAINNLHRNSSDTVKKDNLPPADVIREYFIAAGLHNIKIVDNSRIFAVTGQKE